MPRVVESAHSPISDSNAGDLFSDASDSAASESSGALKFPRRGWERGFAISTHPSASERVFWTESLTLGMLIFRLPMVQPLSETATGTLNPNFQVTITRFCIHPTHFSGTLISAYWAQERTATAVPTTLYDMVLISSGKCTTVRQLIGSDRTETGKGGLDTFRPRKFLPICAVPLCLARSDGLMTRGCQGRECLSLCDVVTVWVAFYHIW